MAKKPKQDRLPSDYKENWKSLLVVYIVLICVVYLFEFNTSTVVIISQMSIFMVLFILNYGKNYILTEEAIICRILCIPYKTIPWKHVIQAGIIIRQYDRNLPYGIVLTLTIRPKRVVKIYSSTRAHLRKDVKLIEKYYGILDYGYDKLVD